jgi:hypothetical protein
VLGPGPPPWRKHEIYRKNTIFGDFGVFNTAGKSVSKIGIYALPPSKSEIYGIFINSRPNFVPLPFNLSLPIPRWVSLLPELLNRSKKKEIVFLFFDFSQLVSIVCRMFDFYLWSSARSPKQRMSVGPQKGAIQAQSQAIYRDLNHDGFNLSLPN